jgi:hypothetical protein
MARDDYAAVKDRVVVGIIPGGTGNTLAYDLRLNSPAKAVECLLKGDVRAIDLGKVEHLSMDNPEHPVDASQHAVFSCNIIGCVPGRRGVRLFASSRRVSHVVCPSRACRTDLRLVFYSSLLAFARICSQLWTEHHRAAKS